MVNETIVLANFYREIKHVNSRPLIPLANLYLASYLKSKGYKVLMQDVRSSDEIDQAIEQALDHNPFLIGISATFGLYTEEYIDYSKKIKSKTDLPVVWGGVHAGSIYDLCLQKDFIDFVVLGEGEIALYELVEVIQKSGELKNVRNLAYRNNGKVQVNNMIPITEKNVDQFPLNFDLLDNYEDYIETQGSNRIFHALQTSRGCPFNCAFCYNNQFNNRRWRQHSVDRVLNDIAKLREKAEFNKIRFVDDLFFANERRAKLIISRMYNEMGISVFAPDARLDNLKEDFIEFLLEHECNHVFVGSESENDRVLSLMKKQLTHERIIERFQTIKKYPKFSVGTGFILGIPGHTESDIRESIDFALRWQKMVPNLKIGLGTYLPYPGTEMYQTALSNGFPKPDDIEFYINCYVSEKTGKFPKFREMEWLHISPTTKAKLNYINWISAFYSSLIIPPASNNILERLFNFPFYLITYIRLKYLISAFHHFDQKIYFILRKIFFKLRGILIPKNDKT